MVPRKKSIFHLGEEGGEATRSGVAIRGLKNLTQASEGLVGLRILIQHAGQGSNIVIKSTLKSCSRPAARARQIPKGYEELGFLKACFLCKKELSPRKDVYMYRGDQGFCSEECRFRQILIDERREFEASTRERLGASHHRRAVSKVRESDRHRRISAAA